MCEEQPAPEVLRVDPIAAGPIHEHDARCADFLAGMKQQMSGPHARFQGNGLSILGVVKVGFPIAGPTHGANQSMIAGLQVEIGKRVFAGAVSVRGLEMIIAVRTEMFLQGLEVIRTSLAALGMPDINVAGRRGDGPVKRQDFLDDRRVGGTVIANMQHPGRWRWDYRKKDGRRR